MVAWDFDLQCDRKSKPEILAALNDMLVYQAERGGTAVLIVDEAHNLEWEVLEEIRLAGQSREPPRQVTADHPCRPAGIRPQT